jgi:Arc/MetJ-type ribon-helix-helix transcriptional regulator
MTISLPQPMIQEVERVRKMEHRTRSELIREALRLYFNPELAARIARLPVYVPTKQELREIEKGRRSKDYVATDELFRGLVGPRPGPRAKGHRPRS